MSQKVDFLIFYEHWQRELMSITLLKLELERRGYSVALCDDPLWCNDSPERYLLYPKVVVHPWLYGDPYVSKARNFATDVQQIVNLQSEQIFSESSYNTGWHWIHGEAQKAMHLAWGQSSAFRFYKWGVPESNICLSGALHMDLCREEFSRAFHSKEVLAQKYALDPSKKWLLFVSSFTLPTMSEENFEYLERNFTRRVISFRKAMRDAKKPIMDWFVSYLEQDSEAIIIYRPHPNEASDPALIELARVNDRFFCIGEETSNQWVRVSNRVTSWISTGMAEATAMGIPFALLRPVKLSTHFEPELYYGAKTIRSYQQFCEFITDGAHAADIDTDLFASYYTIPEKTFAYQLLCDQLENLYHQDKAAGFSEDLRFNYGQEMPTELQYDRYTLLLRAKYENSERLLLDKDTENLDEELKILDEDLTKRLQKRYAVGELERDIEKRLKECVLDAACSSKVTLASGAADATEGEARVAVYERDIQALFDNEAASIVVLVPTYNAEAWLPELIESLDVQTMQNYHVIVVDDCSSDATRHIAERWKSKDSRVTVLYNKEKSGLTNTRNVALQYLFSCEEEIPYACFVAANGRYEPFAFYRLLLNATYDKLDLLMFSGKTAYDSSQVSEERLERTNYYRRRPEYQGVHDGLKHLAHMKKYNDIKTDLCTQLFSTRFLKEHSKVLFDGSVQPYDIFTLTCLPYAQRVSYLNEELYIGAPESDTVSFDGANWRDVVKHFQTGVELIRALTAFSANRERMQDVLESESQIVAELINDYFLKARTTYILLADKEKGFVSDYIQNSDDGLTKTLFMTTISAPLGHALDSYTEGYYQAVEQYEVSTSYKIGRAVTMPLRKLLKRG